MNVDPCVLSSVIASAFGTGALLGYISGYYTAHRRHR